MTAMAALLAIVLAAALSAGLCRLLRPLLLRYALARPNARSSHTVPTPQGGGIAVVLGAIGALLVLALSGSFDGPMLRTLAIVAGAGLALALVGAWDDIRPLPARHRLAMQTAAVLAVLFWAAPEVRLLEGVLPLAAERLVVVLAAVWFINLTNFMDGLDWITVAAVVPASLTIGLLAGLGHLDAGSGLAGLALAGGLLGFAPLNRPVARLFLGDVGALPIGLLLAFLLYRLAGSGALVAALLLPLYSVCDATWTLGRRLLKGERVWEAHRSHFYQRATGNGFSALQVSLHVLGLNILLAGLALGATLSPRVDLRLALLAIGLALTALLLRRFAAGPGGADR